MTGREARFDIRKTIDLISSGLSSQIADIARMNPAISAWTSVWHANSPWRVNATVSAIEAVYNAVPYPSLVADRYVLSVVDAVNPSEL